MQNFNNNNNNNNNPQQFGWDNSFLNNTLQSDYTGWDNNNTNNSSQGDYTNSNWGNNYSQHNYNTNNHTQATDFQKYCTGGFNDYTPAGRKNKSIPSKAYVNNSYASSGYTIPTFDRHNAYSLVQNNPNTVVIGDRNDSKIEKFILLLPFAVIFFGTIIGAVINNFDIGVLIFNIMAVTFLSVFIFIILSLTILPIIKDKNMKKSCKLKIQGSVVDIRFRRTSEGESRYTPIYKYSYNGIDYYLNGISTLSEDIKIGTEFDIYINPNRPKQCYVVMDESGDFKFRFIIGGLIFIGFLIPVISMLIDIYL